ncbi:MAG: DUF58 domain-containing protein [Planctomycetaceae bacterium]|nr:DUF58 domain-containing protein [Planctomycetaceae bacterium]
MTLLPQSTLDRLAMARFPIRRLMNGTRQGNHRSPFTGASAEFAQHREYCPGDEPRRIDWRVLARTDRFVVKQYDQETNLRATILLDASASMRFAGTRATLISKLNHAKQIAAALAWVLMQQGDAVGLVAFDQRVRLRMPFGSTAGHLHRLLEAITGVQPEQPSATATVIHQLAETIPSRGVVILCSDLLDDPHSLQHALYHLRHRNHEIVVMHVLADEEVNFPFSESIRFCDLEGLDEWMDIDPPAIRREYLRQLQQHLSAVKQACHQVAADYLLTTTEQNVADVVINYLATRTGNSIVAGASS